MRDVMYVSAIFKEFYLLLVKRPTKLRFVHLIYQRDAGTRCQSRRDPLSQIGSEQMLT